uniref:Putative ovule protein n=1 Tax=Solanum chacoense TaxID=4108 RepID=A0A0V0HIZ2_SOLCH
MRISKVLDYLSGALRLIISGMLMILFFSALEIEHRSVIKMMKVLRDYERTSGQMINKSKSFFYLYDKTLLIVATRMRRLIGIRQGNFPFLYLGCPVFYGRKVASYFEDLVRKIARRILTWYNRFLSFGGKFVLINDVLQSMPVFLLSAMNPPQKVMEQIHQIFAKFFWGNLGGIRGKHWIAWDEMCLPKNEGGLGFRSIKDINKALICKIMVEI